MELGDTDQESRRPNPALGDEPRQAPAQVAPVSCHRDHHERIIDSIGEAGDRLPDRRRLCLGTGAAHRVPWYRVSWAWLAARRNSTIESVRLLRRTARSGSGDLSGEMRSDSPS